MKNQRAAISFYLQVVFVGCLGLFQTVFGSINFHNRSSAIAMQRGRSLLLVKNNAKVTGWSLESIVRSFGNNSSSQWVEAYTNNIVVSVAGGGARSNLLYATSDAVVRTAARVTWNSNALLRLAKNNSDALLRLNRASSNAILLLDRTVRTNSNASAFAIKNNSNTLLRLTRNNSNAILAGGGGSDPLAQYNSNALLFLRRTFSNAILLLDRTVRTNSNASAFAIKNNSNTLLRLTRNNSNAILLLDRTVRTNSNASAYAIKNNSNTLLRLTRNNSNAILLLDRTVRTNSNASAFAIKNNSNTLLRLTRNNSDALLKLNRASSSAILLLDLTVRTNSNASAFAIKNNSNTLLRLTRNNSSAILLLDRTVRTNSNASAFAIKNNSNTLLRLTKNNSDALLKLTRYNSNALLRLTRNNSDALLKLNRASSSAILLLDRTVRTNSNASAYAIKNNSNTILAGTGGNALAQYTSNAMLYLTKNNSNTFLRLIKNISDSLLNLDLDIDPNLIIAGPTFTMQRSYEVSTDGTVTVTGNTTLNGNGHSFKFGKSSTSFSIDASKFLILTNVILKNFENGSISLGSGASVVFGEGTRIELADAQSLTTNMTFSGAAIVQGFGNKMTMNNAVISVLPGGRLTLQDLFVDGLKRNNIRAMGNSASVKFKNSILSLASDYSFTSGRILFEMDVQLVGTNTFGYRPTNAGSKILARSKLALDTGVTFSYAPVAANRDLLGMVDRSSILSLNGCTLKSTTTGMRLTNGLLLVDHKNQIFNDGATSVSQAVAFGNGTPANDLEIEILPGARLLVNSGQLAYQNAS